MSNDDAIEKAKAEMSKTAHETATQSTGACVYNSGGKTYCAVLTKPQCDFVHGAWVAGKGCP
jgi:hypothetical protein